MEYDRGDGIILGFEPKLIPFGSGLKGKLKGWFKNHQICEFLQSWPNSQIWWFFKSDTVIFNDTVQCFSMNEWCQ